MLLTSEMRARLERLALTSRGRIRANLGGRHASRRKGESLDFADFRPYVAGDDFRRIDQHLYARLGQLVVREYQAEDELTVRIVVDVSASMGLHRKSSVAAEIAAMITYLVLAGGDRVALYAIPGRERPLMIGPAGRHISVWPRLESWLEGLTTGGTMPMAPTVRNLVGSASIRGSTVIVSDMFDPEWEKVLDGLGLGAGGLVFHVLGREEIEPDLFGDLRLVDVETGGEAIVSFSEEAGRAYRQRVESFVQGVAGRSRRAGLDYLLVPTADDALDRALFALAGSGVVR
jgi:hypothetical protein